MKSFISQFIVAIFAISLVLITNMGVNSAYAQSSPPTPESLNVGSYLKAIGQNQPSNIGESLVRIINFFSAVIGSFAFLAIVVGGLLIMISADNTSLLDKGKDIIKFSIIGLIVALSAYFITSAVQSLFFEYELPAQ